MEVASFGSRGKTRTLVIRDDADQAIIEGYALSSE
jgi:hypothetical protein